MPQATSYPTQPAYGAQYGVMQQVPQQAAGGYTLQGAAQQQTYYWEVPSQISVPSFVCLLYAELLNLLGYENVSLEPPHLWWFWIQCKQDASLAAVVVFIFPSAASSHWHLVWRTILQLFFLLFSAGSNLPELISMSERNLSSMKFLTYAYSWYRFIALLGWVWFQCHAGPNPCPQDTDRAAPQGARYLCPP